MKIRVTGSYYATDGTTPKTVDVEIEPTDGGEPLPPEVIAGLVTDTIDRLVAVPQRRGGYRQPLPQVANGAPVDRCRRTLCGDERRNHGPVDAGGNLVGHGNGACEVCDSADKCRSFVGEPVKGAIAAAASAVAMATRAAAGR